jgi:hypothetical protein
MNPFVRIAAVTTIAVALVLGIGLRSEASAKRPTLASLVATFSNGEPSRKLVERALGVRLKTGVGTSAFAVFEAGPVRLNGIRLTGLELRSPLPGEEVTAGPLLILKVSSKNCVDRDQTLEAFGPLQLSGTPRGNSLDEETSYARIESWGTLSFGFAERSPDCLSSVVFNRSL